MSRRKLFVENIFAYGFINVLSKIVPFLLLPFITRMLPDASDFGIYSMYTTIVGFGTPLAVLGIQDAMFREYFEKDDLQYKYDVTSTTQRIILFSSILVASLLIVFNKNFSTLFFNDSSYSNIINLSGIAVFLGANSIIIQAPTRMQNQKRVFVFSGLISSIVTYFFALLLIFLGLSYFGLIYSSIVATTILIIFFWINNRTFFLKGSFDAKIAKELFKIGLPLLPTFLIYWIYNSMDKLMILNILGTFELGVYSIGSKMAQVSQLIYAGFSGGYSYFKYSTMKDSDQVDMNSKLFEFLSLILVLSFVALYPLIPGIFKLLFEGNYVQGYIVAPYLFLSPLLLMLFQVVGSQFIVIKKSYLASTTLAFGALLNVLLNFIFIKYIGIEGAAVSTLIGYISSVMVVCFIAKNKGLLIISKRVIVVFLVGLIYLVLNRFMFHNHFLLSISSSGIATITMLYLYLKEANIIIAHLRLRIKIQRSSR